MKKAYAVSKLFNVWKSVLISIIDMFFQPIIRSIWYGSIVWIAWLTFQDPTNIIQITTLVTQAGITQWIFRTQ
jgi:hypothetical protein